MEKGPDCKGTVVDLESQESFSGWLNLKKIIFLMAVTIVAPVFAEMTPTVTPTFTATTAGTPTPTPTYNPYPTFPPTPIGSPAVMKREAKDPNWISSTGLGLGVPLSAHLTQAYGSGFAADLGTGYKFSEDLSLWLDGTLELFNSKNDTLTGGNNFNLVGLALLVRYRFSDSGLMPYLFAGPGVAYNENRSDQGINYDVNTGYGYIPVNSYEFDPLVEVGLGLEMDFEKGMGVYFQGRLIYDMASTGFASQAYNDSPLTVMPFEMGLLFGL